MLSSRVFGGGEESRPNSTPADTPPDVDRCAMLAVFEPIGRKSEYSLIRARLMLDCDEEKWPFFIPRV